MNDFRIVQARALLPVHTVAPVRGFQPVSVAVMGERLEQTEEVFYNDVQASEFAVVSGGQLLVRVPDSQLGLPLKQLQVFAPVSLTRTSALVGFGLGRPPRAVSGLERLVQAFLVVFYTTPGSDIFSPESGGGGRSIIGRTTDSSGHNVTADLVEGVERTKSELMRLQAQNPHIPPSERLLSCELAHVQFDPETSTVYGRVSLTNILNESVDLSIR